MSGHAAPKKPSLRRFSWCRIHHDLLDDTRWRLVARMAGAPQHLVEIFVLRLEIFASANTPRGSLDGLNIPALAAHWNLSSDEQLARIYAALEHPEVGWIDQEHVVTFWERNPDVEDATATERKRRSRVRQKAAKEAARVNRSTGYPQSRVTHRDTVTVTTRSDQSFSTQPVDNSGAVTRGEAAKPSDEAAAKIFDNPQAAAAAWLLSTGTRIVAERMEITAAAAATKIERWSHQGLEGDVVALAEIVRAADDTDLMGARFHNLVVDQIRRRQQQIKCPQLPLMPPRPGAKEKRHA